MKWIYGFLVVMIFSRFQCEDKHDVIVCGTICPYEATVKDLSGLDGCGFVLEMKDGSRLIPQRLTYIQPPDSLQDPGYYFNFKHDQRVCFGYREVEGVDVCMAGNLVFLTCIAEMGTSDSPD